MKDILNRDQAKKEILSLANRVAHRMRREEVRGSTVSLKVKYSNFTQITRAETLPDPTDDSMEIYSTSCRLLKKTAVGKRPVRLLGISLSRLSSPEGEKQLFLFDQDKEYRKRKDLNTALDSICDKFGEKGIRPATLISKS